MVAHARSWQSPDVSTKKATTISFGVPSGFFLQLWDMREGILRLGVSHCCVCTFNKVAHPHIQYHEWGACHDTSFPVWVLFFLCMSCRFVKDLKLTRPHQHLAGILCQKEHLQLILITQCPCYERPYRHVHGVHGVLSDFAMVPTMSFKAPWVLSKLH